MMKKMLPWCLSSTVVMLALPWLAVTLVKGDKGMAACFLLFFAVNPVYAVCAGAYAGRNIKSAWTLPIITSGLFLAGTWIFFDWGEPAFWQYALAYLLLGIAAMLISMCIKRH